MNLGYKNQPGSVKRENILKFILGFSFVPKMTRNLSLHEKIGNNYIYYHRSAVLKLQQAAENKKNLLYRLRGLSTVTVSRDLGCTSDKFSGGVSSGPKIILRIINREKSLQFHTYTQIQRSYLLLLGWHSHLCASVSCAQHPASNKETLCSDADLILKQMRKASYIIQLVLCEALSSDRYLLS